MKSLTKRDCFSLNHHKNQISVTDEKQLVSVEKQSPSFCKLYSFHAELQDEPLDVKFVDCFFSPQRFWHLLFPAWTWKSAKKINKIFSDSNLAHFAIVNRTALYIQRRSYHFQKRTLLFSRKFARNSPNLWAKQQLCTSSNTKHQKKISIYKIKKKAFSFFSFI